MNGKTLAALAVAGGLAYYLFSKKGNGKGVFNPFKTTGTADKPPQFGLKPANNGGFGLPSTRSTGNAGSLSGAFGAVAGLLDRIIAGAAQPRSGPGTPDIIEGPNGTVYRNTGSTYEPYITFPVPNQEEPGFTIENRDFSLGGFDDPSFNATLPDTLPEIGGGYAPETGFDYIDTGAAEGLA